MMTTAWPAARSGGWILGVLSFVFGLGPPAKASVAKPAEAVPEVREVVAGLEARAGLLSIFVDEDSLVKKEFFALDRPVPEIHDAEI